MPALTTIGKIRKKLSFLNAKLKEYYRLKALLSAMDRVESEIQMRPDPVYKENVKKRMEELELNLKQSLNINDYD